MTSQSRPESTLSAREQPGVSGLGSSVYGGRPNFALVRDGGPDGGTLTLYELLPADQATARRERLERSNPNRQLVADSFEDVFGESDSLEVDHWDWDEWTAVKIRQLSGNRLRSILPLVRETLGGTGIDDSSVTGSGQGKVFLPETAGVRLAVGFVGVKPIQRVDRMRAFCRGIARMSDEECYYWHAKCRSPSSPNGEKALRTLLTDHIK
ncbi:DUF7680 family protein [Natronorubrum sulfidifaciens]|uniref:DUF7680 domain-containing protein n=1 Tax=Natronorubrum sulfidifaciens JCM 14089 TaxID=1230460 RepID=L9VYZ9_9EURY|nr:hypothetical protein [Natronorubrum sulfidifaciens]ELY41468.1 hypothetical protein C495_16770 [Natronorubrum sulfidifaciens JCM 14089]